MAELLEALMERGIRMLWADSLGAKTMCLVVETSVGRAVVDPGVAEMQPGYPLPLEEKYRIRDHVMGLILRELRGARAVFITHYHYDHFLAMHSHGIDPAAYAGTSIIAKNPNQYINESQWERARLFVEELARRLGVEEELYGEPEAADFEDPAEKLATALSRDFGDYNNRRAELLRRGREWFRKLAGLWSRDRWVREVRLGGGTRLTFGDGRTFEFGDATIRVFEPYFHGAEYERTGWVVPLLIERGGFRVYYTSDLMGPIVEDYAEEIARLRPDVAIVDGPPTYLYPYMLNRINLSRAVTNLATIIAARPKLIIYDHHILREKRWRRHVEPALQEARRSDVAVLTVAELHGRKPLIDSLGH